MKERRRLAWAASLLVLLGTAAAVLAGSPTDESDPAARAGPAPVRGLAAEVVDRRRRLGRGRVAWQTRWRLCWRRQAGARDYLVTIVTSEGVDPVPQSTRRRCFALTVASGSAPAGRVREQRDAQLGLVEPSLAVSVAARMPDGRIGPPSPDVSVGVRYPRPRR